MSRIFKKVKSVVTSPFMKKGGNDKVGKWKVDTDYVVGNKVKFHGATYTCTTGHKSAKTDTPWSASTPLKWRKDEKVKPNVDPKVDPNVDPKVPEGPSLAVQSDSPTTGQPMSPLHQ